MEDLQKTFTSPAWILLKDPQSSVYKLFCHPCFKTKKGGNQSSAENISVLKLLVFAILHCHGDSEDRAEALYRAIQDGGPEKHAFLSATDKDIAPVFESLIKFVLTDLTRLMSDTVSIHPMDVDMDKDDELDACLEDIFEYNFLEPVFGVNSRLTFEEFVYNVQRSSQFNKLFF